MSGVERFVFRVLDWDVTWYGLSWLRPANWQRISAWRLVLISFLLSLPSFICAVGLLHLGLGPVDPAVCLALFAAMMLVQLGLNGFGTWFWNRRAATLSSPVPDRR